MHAENLLSRVFSTVIFLSQRFSTQRLEIILYVAKANSKHIFEYIFSSATGCNFWNKKYEYKCTLLYFSW